MARRRKVKHPYRTIEQDNRIGRLHALPSWVIKPFEIKDTSLVLVSSNENGDTFKDIDTGEKYTHPREAWIERFKKLGIYTDKKIF